MDNPPRGSRRSFLVRGMTAAAGAWLALTGGALASLFGVGCDVCGMTAKYGGPPDLPVETKYGGPAAVPVPPAPRSSLSGAPEHAEPPAREP